MTAQDGLKTAQDPSKMPQEAPKTLQDSQKTPLRRPKTTKYRPNTPPKRPKIDHLISSSHSMISSRHLISSHVISYHLIISYTFTNSTWGGSYSTGLPLPLPPALDHPPAATLYPPKITPYLTSTSLNFTPLNSTHLNSLFDPPRPPFWSLLAPQIDPRSVQVAS